LRHCPAHPLSGNPPPCALTLIEIDHVTFGYDASRTILNDVSLRFGRGKVTAVLGGRAAARPRCCG
jgi:ABC-type multidrug transport system fused ATPase/permease subunit